LALPLGEFVVQSGVVTEVRLTVDLAPAQVRVFQADGTTAAAGVVMLQRLGWYRSCELDERGFAELLDLPRGETLEVALLERTGVRPDGSPVFALPVMLGKLVVGAAQSVGELGVVEFRLPAR
jgi:hypothetical protein